TLDADEDGVPDDCDVCPGEDDDVDTDEDGIPDGCDACEGFDDTEDMDDDGIPDGCDQCPATEECNICYEACYYTEVTCGYTNACAASGFNCTNEDSYCESACMLDASCAAIASMVGANPDPELSACINACDPANQCNVCTASSCQSEFAACSNDATCTNFLQCSQACADSACVATCGTTYPTTLGADLQSCMCTNCNTECTTLCN
ncbi:hypothetical protein KKF84_04945, partial [Myxococcota bacterium]|nr:hypothetical protein [Myxococcota bacterium]